VHQGNQPTRVVGGSRKGVDLTIGKEPPPILSKHFIPVPPISKPPESKDLDLCGGILLRSLRQLGPNGGKVISGPSPLVDRIISVSGASSIADLVENKWGGDTYAFIDGKDERRTRLFLRSPRFTSPQGSV